MVGVPLDTVSLPPEPQRAPVGASSSSSPPSPSALLRTLPSALKDQKSGLGIDGVREVLLEILESQTAIPTGVPGFHYPLRPCCSLLPVRSLEGSRLRALHLLSALDEFQPPLLWPGSTLAVVGIGGVYMMTGGLSVSLSKQANKE